MPIEWQLMNQPDFVVGLGKRGRYIIDGASYKEVRTIYLNNNKLFVSDTADMMKCIEMTERMDLEYV